MKSKTPRISQSSKPKKTKKADAGGLLASFQPGLAEALSVGHQPLAELAPRDEALFRAFQANLLSLISHELRTPLMGVLNALSLIEERSGPEHEAAEWVRMARENAQRLQRALAALLDLAAIESGSFHARLREVDLGRIAQGRLDAFGAQFPEAKGRIEVLPGEHSDSDSSHGGPILADPQKLGRAIDLCFQLWLSKGALGQNLQLRISFSSVRLSFALRDDIAPLWDAAWSQALAGFQGGVASPGSAFSGVLQSEREFLSRMEEGLGSEFLLIHQIMLLHRGEFIAAHGPNQDHEQIILTLELPELASEEGLKAVLASRAYSVSTELGSVALILIEIPSSAHESQDESTWVNEIRKHLFRSSDAVYWLKKRRQVALILEDCRPEDAPRLMRRIEGGKPLKFGVAHCPDDGLDPSLLLPLAEGRMR
ncbi:histidine kinase dimerization/phospho-acceptor domain-containing protein [Bdellovibrionota bacterium FG-1]